MPQPHLLKGVILQIPHDGVEFHHRVADGGTGRKGNPPAAGDLIQILALHKHIRAFLCVRLGDAGHVPHFCVEEHIFVKMAFVHKQPVNAQLFKGDHIVLARLVVQLFQAYFQRFLGLFHLLDGEVSPSLVFGIRNGRRNIVNLAFNRGNLPFPGQGDTLKLAVADDNGVIVACGDPGAELFSVRRFKVLLGRYQDVRAGIQA